MEWSSVAVIGIGAFVAWKILSVIKSLVFRVLGLVGAVIGIWRMLSFLEFS